MPDENLLKLIKNTIENPSDTWKNHVCNCYMYAILADLDARSLDFPFRLGVLSDTFSYLRNKSEMEYSLYKDMDILDINIEKIDPFIYDLEQNEWKIALYLSDSFDLDGENANDFHFIRECKESVWLHKQGYYGKIKRVNFKFGELIHPKNANISAMVNNQQLNYEYVGSYKLSLKK